MKLAKLRKALKAIDPEITISSWFGGEGCQVRTNYNLEAVLKVMVEHGFKKHSHGHEGPRWDTTHVIAFIPDPDKVVFEEVPGGLQKLRLLPKPTNYKDGVVTPQCGCEGSDYCTDPYCDYQDNLR